MDSVCLWCAGKPWPGSVGLEKRSNLEQGTLKTAILATLWNFQNTSSLVGGRLKLSVVFCYCAFLSPE